MNYDSDAADDSDTGDNQSPDASSGTQRAAGATGAKGRTSCGTFLLGMLFCVGFPALFTAVAPVSYVHLERPGDGVRATSSTCLLYCVPYWRQEVAQVVGVNNRFRAGELSRRKPGERQTRSEDEAFLILHGATEDDYLEVSVSPINIASRVERVERFLNDPQAKELDLFCVSNWKFAIFAGGIVSLLTVLWVIGIVATLVRWYLSLFRFGEK